MASEIGEVELVVFERMPPLMIDEVKLQAIDGISTGADTVRISGWILVKIGRSGCY